MSTEHGMTNNNLPAAKSARQAMNSSDQVRTPYFYTPGLKALVQQIVHFAFFGDGLSVVSGEHGIGKSALASELVKHFDQAHDVVLIQLDSDVELAECIERLCASLTIQREDELSVGEMLADLRHYIQALFQDDKQVIVIVDGAHHLEDQALGALVSLVQDKPEGNAGLHLVFLAEPGLDQRIDQLQVLDVTVYDFQIPKFSPTELGNFLAAESPLGAQLESSQVQKLWVESMGIPGLALSRLQKNSSEDSPSGGGINIPLGHIAAVSLLAAVLLLSFWIYDDRERDDTPSPALAGTGSGKSTTVTEVAIPGLQATASPVPEVQTPAALPSSQPTSAAAVLSESASDSVETVPVPTFTPSVSAGSDLAESAPVTPEPLVSTMGRIERDLSSSLENSTEELVDSPSSQDSAAPVSAPVSGAEPPVAATPVPSAAPALTPAPTASSAPTAKPKTASLSALDEWEKFLLRQKPEAYTLQVIAASNNVALEDYIARQSNKASLRMYRGAREGKKWFVVVQGIYASKEAALAAIPTLPKDQAKAGPWPRKLASIQEEIQSFRRASP